MTHNRYPPTRTQPPVAMRAVIRLGRVVAGLIATGLLAVLIAGVPYGLWHWIGWPLPHHVPTSNRIKDTLTGPFTDQMLLDTLACLCWILWAVFLTDLAQALPDTLRNTRHPHTAAASPGTSGQTGPLRGLAALLLTAILAGLLSLRPHPTSAARSTAPLAAPRPGIVATALHMDRGSVPTTAAPIPSSARAVVVQPPHEGIHDSLWRIAQRCLGDGTRWPEIYQLNKGHPQPDGDSLTVPSLIQPGWIFRLPGPAIATTPTPPHAATPPPSTPSHGAAPAQPSPPLPTPTSSATTSAPVGQTPAAPSQPADQSGHSGIDLGDGVFVSLGLAGAISAAVLTERRRRRRRYVPGSGRRDDLLPIAPVVRSLHLAHLRTTESAAHGDTDIDETDEPDEHADGLGSTSQPSWSRPDVETADSDELMHSVNDAAHNPRPAAAAPADSTGDLRATVAQALELAVTGGLGLVGPGADNAIRGLMLEFLTSPGHPRPPALGTTSPAVQFGLDGADRPGGGDVVMPAATADHLLGHARARRTPLRLHVTADSGGALDQLEAIMLHRARLRRGRAGMGSAEQSPGPVVLTAHVPQDVRRLQAVLDNAAALGIGGLLIGQWRPGSSLYVTANGRVTSTSPGPARHLHRKRLPTLTAAAAHDLLSALTPDPASVPTPAQADPPDDVNAVEAPHAGASRREMAGSHGRNGAAATNADVALDFFPAVHATSTVAPELAHDAGPAATESLHDPAADLDAHGRVLLRVLGPVRLTWRTTGQPASDDGQRVHPSAKSETVTVSLGPRQRELLLALALHPDGIARDLLADMLWPDTPPGRPFNTLHTTLNRLRRNLAAASGGALTELTRTDGDRYQLDPQVVAADYQQLQVALAARRAATDDEPRAQACRAILAAYTGELGEGASPDWAETPRESVRRDVLDAAVTLARHAATTDPQEALDVLETARSLDPYNEQLYRDIMRLQRRLGRVSSIGHTLALLTTRLTEIDQTPEPPTIALAQQLTGPAPSNRDASQPDDNGAGSHLPAAG